MTHSIDPDTPLRRSLAVALRWLAIPLFAALASLALPLLALSIATL